MMRTCIIIEDQPPAQRILQKYIADVGSLALKATFSDALKAIAYLQEYKVDLIFLDIHLPKISGMDFLKALKTPPQVILTTAFSEYALESYEYHVVDYLLKPFSFQRFVQAISRSSSVPNGGSIIQSDGEPVSRDTFFIKSGHDLVKIRSDEILIIQSDSDYTEIVTVAKAHLSTESLKNWRQKLGTTFCQIHKSYIINTDQIQKISGNQVYLKHGITVPIGRAYKENFVSMYLK